MRKPLKKLAASLSMAFALATGAGAYAADPAPTTQATTIGTKLSNKTVYAGISPSTNKPMFAAKVDFSLTITFSVAKLECASMRDADGQGGFRIPSKSELNVLFNNRAAIGNFDTSGSDPAGYYWSSSLGNANLYWIQKFSEGTQHHDYRGNTASVRCVR